MLKFILALWLVTAQAANFEDHPNLTYEAELHNIYLQYYTKTLDDEEWDHVVGDRASEEYNIQKGDNLWDLSKTFFGDGNYWPKIWSVNAEIPNPHLVEPGLVIRFILGTTEQAPMFMVTEPQPKEKVREEKAEVSQDQAQEIDLSEPAVNDQKENFVFNLEDDFAQDEDEAGIDDEYLTDEEIDEIVIPPPSTTIVPIAKNFPPSLPKWKSISEQLLQSLKIELGEHKVVNTDPIVPMTYFIDENLPEGLGTVATVEGGNKVASQYQHVFIRSKKFEALPGRTYLAVNKVGPLISKKGVQEDAITYEVQGMVKILDKLEATQRYKSDDYDVYRAEVVSTLTPITVGAELYDEDYTYTKLDLDGDVGSVSGMIVGGEYDQKRNLVMTGSLIYVNRGANEGLDVGQMLPIYANNFIDDDSPYVATTNNPVGIMKIARVSPMYSTGYIVENNGPINVGDFVGVKDGFEQINSEKPVASTKEKQRDRAEAEALKHEVLSLKKIVPQKKQETFEYEGEDESIKK